MRITKRNRRSPRVAILAIRQSSKNAGSFIDFESQFSWFILHRMVD